MPLYGREAPDDEQKYCPKHVELLLPIIKLELSASVGFIHEEYIGTEDNVMGR
jgi:hypothetical protein